MSDTKERDGHGRRSTVRRNRDRWTARVERAGIIVAIVLWVLATISLQGQQNKVDDVLAEQSRDRIDAAVQRCDLTRTIVQIIDATDAPSEFGAPLRANLAECRDTVLKYRRQAGELP